EGKGRPLQWEADLAPGKSFTVAQERPKLSLTGATLRIISRDGREIIAYAPQPRHAAKVPAPATEPPPPAEIASADELYLTGLHLEQYRHATRPPTLY